MPANAKLMPDLEGMANTAPDLSRRGFFMTASAAAAAGYTLAQGPVRAEVVKTGTEGLTVGDAKVKVVYRELPILSNESGDVATLVKLLRVAMLLPVILLASSITRARLAADGTTAAGKRPPLLPGFAVAFAALTALNSTGWVPHAIQAGGSEASRWFLVAAIAGIGMKTQLKDLVTVGFKPVALMIGETAFLAALAMACHAGFGAVPRPLFGIGPSRNRVVRWVYFGHSGRTGLAACE